MIFFLTKESLIHNLMFFQIHYTVIQHSPILSGSHPLQYGHCPSMQEDAIESLTVFSVTTVILLLQKSPLLQTGV